MLTSPFAEATIFLLCAFTDAAAFDDVLAAVETVCLAVDLAAVEFASTVALPFAAAEPAKLARLLLIPVFTLPFPAVIADPVKLALPLLTDALPFSVDEPFTFASFLPFASATAVLAVPLTAAAWFEPA